MESQRMALNVYRDLVAPDVLKYKTKEPCVFLGRSDALCSLPPLQSKIEVFSREDINTQLDRESHLVRWVDRQLQTYDPEKEVIIGLLFDKGTILTDVLPRRR